MSKVYKKSDGTSVVVTEDNYRRARDMTAEEIEEAAKSDPDAKPLTIKELRKFKRAFVKNGLKKKGI